VYASDSSNDQAVQQNARALEAIGATVEVGGHDLQRIASASCVVVSPGVAPDVAPVVAARSAGVPVISEVELALRLRPDLRYIAVTGTNGKTTTTALAGHLLRSMGYVAVDAGNIGTPLCDIAGMAEPPAWVALELSSFQLHDTPSVKPVVGVLTNLSPDHLDRYASVSDYYADKALLFRNAHAESRWVVNRDDPQSLRMVENVTGAVHTFATTDSGAVAPDAWYNRDADELVVRGTPLIRRPELALLGDHNVGNALAAALAVKVADTQHDSTEMNSRIADGLRTFRALPHRLEPVAEDRGVVWINDSKATNVSSTLMAVRAMTRPTVLLLGGKHKGEPYSSLAEDIAKRCRLVIAYGAAADTIAADLDGVVPLRKMGSSFADVMEAARETARSGDAVLLSPACSSFDMFRNYEDRGNRFREMAVTP
jgi:UDP-N-acetylmuramoylalanine--D-glutamate ligase